MYKKKSNILYIYRDNEKWFNMRSLALFLLALAAGYTAVRATTVKVKDVPKPFDLKLANESIYLVQAVLCESSTFASRTYLGASAGFRYKATIHDEKTDTNGFIGVLDEKIFVVYRGTSSKLDWMDDAEAWQDPAEYSECKDCLIHHGFNKCIDNTIKDVLTALESLRKEHPTFPIVCVGHSLGGALTNLAAIELISAGFTNVLHYSFGSPRVGNAAWADYSNKVIPHAQRITHYKDSVPHVPPTTIPLVAHYQHILSEVYEDEHHVLHGCVGIDDQSCCMQWGSFETSPSDHNLYLDVPTTCPDNL